MTALPQSWWPFLAVDRGLGDVERASNRVLSSFSQACQQGADNLLANALRRLAAGDEAGAARLVERAARLPYDSYEDAAPAAVAAHMLLFTAVMVELESSDENDSTWLDAALALLPAATERDRFEMRDTLVPLRQDFDLTKAEARRIDAALRDIPEDPGLSDMGNLPVAELEERVTGTLRLVLAYAVALDALTNPV